MTIRCALIAAAMMLGAGSLSRADEATKNPEKLFPDVHKNHVNRASAEVLGWSRRVGFYYDYAIAAELAKETGRPMFVIFCRAGTITDPLTGKPKCAS